MACSLGGVPEVVSVGAVVVWVEMVRVWLAVFVSVWVELVRRVLCVVRISRGLCIGLVLCLCMLLQHEDVQLLRLTPYSFLRKPIELV